MYRLLAYLHQFSIFCRALLFAGWLQVLPGLYVGGLGDVWNPKQMTEAKITHVLSVYDGALESLMEVCLRIPSCFLFTCSCAFTFMPSFIHFFLFYLLIFPPFPIYKRTSTRMTSCFNFLFLGILVSFDFSYFKILFSFIKLSLLIICSAYKFLYVRLHYIWSSNKFNFTQAF